MKIESLSGEFQVTLKSTVVKALIAIAMVGSSVCKKSKAPRFGGAIFLQAQIN